MNRLTKPNHVRRADHGAERPHVTVIGAFRHGGDGMYMMVRPVTEGLLQSGLHSERQEEVRGPLRQDNEVSSKLTREIQPGAAIPAAKRPTRLWFRGSPVFRPFFKCCSATVEDDPFRPGKVHSNSPGACRVSR